MERKILYADKLIEIREDEIIFHKYYFPTMSDKIVKFQDIEKIEVREPILKNGKFRIWGTGDFQHWFPMDSQRSKREAIYILYRKGKKIRIGFTVEDSEKVTKLLKEKIAVILD